MDQHEWLAKQFEGNRDHLRAVAYRMLGSSHEAEDAVQESWLRLSRSDAGSIENLSGWLTTVVARVCLDMLRSRSSRREQSLDIPETPQRVGRGEDRKSPEYEALMADSVGVALSCSKPWLPAERVAFVLHDMFDASFEDIAPILGRSAAAARQLASRARRRVQGASAARESNLTRQRKVVDAFLAASRNGDFDALLAVLDPGVVLHADRLAVDMSAARASQGAPKVTTEMRGASVVAETFKGRAGAAQPALVNGAVGLVWAPGGKPGVVFALTISCSKITAIDLIADPEHIRQLEV
ncbi:MAG: sigma-70 family RNA polymerase sigma factor, partial [Solirubrobacterales bacterium]|nr:sigma-70 family RNA polymerase sigma factor [Solirubrobacterales bacterium]